MLAPNDIYQSGCFSEKSTIYTWVCYVVTFRSNDTSAKAMIPISTIEAHIVRGSSSSFIVEHFWGNISKSYHNYGLLSRKVVYNIVSGDVEFLPDC